MSNKYLNYCFIGDIVIVEHIEKHIKSDVLVIPEITRNYVMPIKAKVLSVGKLVMPRSHYLQKRKARGCNIKTFACDDIQVGDIVLVPEELGTRNRISENPNAIIMDGEDILGKVEEEFGTIVST